MTRPVLSNIDARRLFLDRHALLEPPTGPSKGDDLLALIHRLGFVQVDSINTVERAHHMILWSRRQSYRPRHLTPLLERDRRLFEHWTHDAAVVPAAFFRYWKCRFERETERLRAKWSDWHGTAFHDKVEDVLAHVRDGGPVGSGEVGTDEQRGKGGWWEWHPSKTALEYLWRTGQLSVCHRRHFAKVYDLTERVLPDVHAEPAPSHEEMIDWACNAALDRLGFATSGELAAFWALVRPDEAKDWCAKELGRGAIEEIATTCADGSLRRAFARPGLMDEIATLPAPTGRVRILSPFDPALRDRNRAERLFGFHYRIEVFVPEPQRTYGYYVFPVMEGDRMIGRIDMKTRRAEAILKVAAYWPERGLTLTAGREARLLAELQRLATFCGCDTVQFADDWRKRSLDV
jgi:uncharacterized protein YcaQ